MVYITLHSSLVSLRCSARAHVTGAGCPQYLSSLELIVEAITEFSKGIGGELLLRPFAKASFAIRFTSSVSVVRQVSREGSRCGTSRGYSAGPGYSSES